MYTKIILSSRETTLMLEVSAYPFRGSGARLPEIFQFPPYGLQKPFTRLPRRKTYRMTVGPGSDLHHFFFQ
jgi:hypothetical protein